MTVRATYRRPEAGVQTPARAGSDGVATIARRSAVKVIRVRPVIVALALIVKVVRRGLHIPIYFRVRDRTAKVVSGLHIHVDLVALDIGELVRRHVDQELGSHVSCHEETDAIISRLSGWALHRVFP